MNERRGGMYMPGPGGHRGGPGMGGPGGHRGGPGMGGPGGHRGGPGMGGPGGHRGGPGMGGPGGHMPPPPPHRGYRGYGYRRGGCAPGCLMYVLGAVLAVTGVITLIL